MRTNPHNTIFAWKNALQVGTPPLLQSAFRYPGGGVDWIDFYQSELVASWYLGQEAVATLADVAEHRITKTWTDPQPVDLVAIIGHNLTEEEASTFRVRIWTADGSVIDSGVQPAYPAAPLGYVPWGDARFWGHVVVGPWDRRWAWVLDDLVFATQVVIDINGAVAAPVTQLAIPLAFVGPSWQVHANYEKGSASGLHSVGDLQGADYGAPLADADPAPRMWSGIFRHLTEGEVRAQLPALLAHTGRGKLPFLALLEPGTDYGRMASTMLAFIPEALRVTKSTAVAGEHEVELELREWLA